MYVTEAMTIRLCVNAIASLTTSANARDFRASRASRRRVPATRLLSNSLSNRLSPRWSPSPSARETPYGTTTRDASRGGREGGTGDLTAVDDHRRRGGTQTVGSTTPRLGETPDAEVNRRRGQEVMIRRSSLASLSYVQLTFFRCVTPSVRVLSLDPKLRKRRSQPRKQKPPCSLTGRSSLSSRWARRSRCRNATSDSPWRAPRCVGACSPPPRGDETRDPCSCA